MVVTVTVTVVVSTLVLTDFVLNLPHIIVVTLCERCHLKLIDEAVLDVVGVKSTIGRAVDQSKLIAFVEIPTTLNLPVVVVVTFVTMFETRDFMLITRSSCLVGTNVVRMQILSSFDVFQSNMIPTTYRLPIFAVVSVAMCRFELKPVIVVFTVEASYLLLSRTIWVIDIMAVQPMTG